MTGYFQEITNPSQKKYGFPLKEIYENLGDGVVLGDVDETTLPAHQRVLLSEQKKLDNLFPSIS